MNVGIVWITSQVQEQIEAEADRCGEYETGGVLLGYWANGSQNAVVTACVGPGLHAAHSTDHFRPDWEYQTHEIARLYQESGRLLHYLGDWHSHPAGHGRLSRLDHRTLRSISRHGDARVASPIMLIAAGGSPWSLHAWQLNEVRRWFSGWSRVRELLVRSFDKNLID